MKYRITYPFCKLAYKLGFKPYFKFYIRYYKGWYVIEKSDLGAHRPSDLCDVSLAVLVDKEIKMGKEYIRKNLTKKPFTPFYYTVIIKDE